MTENRRREERGKVQGLALHEGGLRPARRGGHACRERHRRAGHRQDRRPVLPAGDDRRRLRRAHVGRLRRMRADQGALPGVSPRLGHPQRQEPREGRPSDSRAAERHGERGNDRCRPAQLAPSQVRYIRQRLLARRVVEGADRRDLADDGKRAAPLRAEQPARKAHGLRLRRRRLHETGTILR